VPGSGYPRLQNEINLTCYVYGHTGRDSLFPPALAITPTIPSAVCSHGHLYGIAVSRPLTVLERRLQRNSWDLLRCSQLMRPGEKPEALLYSPTTRVAPLEINDAWRNRRW